MTRTKLRSLLPFPVPSGITVCFTASRHRKFSNQFLGNWCIVHSNVAANNFFLVCRIHGGHPPYFFKFWRDPSFESDTETKTQNLDRTSASQRYDKWCTCLSLSIIICQQVMREKWHLAWPGNILMHS